MSLSIGTRIDKRNPDLDFSHAWEVVSSQLLSKAQVELIQHESVKTFHFYFACPYKKQILSMSSQNIKLFLKTSTSFMLNQSFINQ